MKLTRLAVAACSLEELPPGPYLRNLQELVLFANNLRWAASANELVGMCSRVCASGVLPGAWCLATLYMQ